MRKKLSLKRIPLLITGFVILLGTALPAQNFVFNPLDEAQKKSLESFDLQGKFAVSYASDENNLYYLVDFSKLSTRFEKVYFINLSFSEQKIVNVDGDLTKDHILFKAGIRYPETEIVGIFDQLKKITEEKAKGMSPAGMEFWLKQNDKYK